MNEGVTIWEGITPVQGSLIYAGPKYCLIFGLLGIGVMKSYLITHQNLKPYVYVAGSFCVLMQSIFLGIDISKYDGFTIFDGAILPIKLLGMTETYSSFAAVLNLALPCFGIIASHALVVYYWIRYKSED